MGILGLTGRPIPIPGGNPNPNCGCMPNCSGGFWNMTGLKGRSGAMGAFILSFPRLKLLYSFRSLAFIWTVTYGSPAQALLRF